MNNRFVILLVTLLLFSFYAHADNWKWIPNSNILYNQEVNLEWNFSDYELNVLDFNKLPENMSFCAAIPDAMITISLLSFVPAEGEKIQDLWNGEGDLFFEGFMKSIKGQLGSFPGIQYGEIEKKNCYFLFKKAIKFSVHVSVSDARMGTDEPLKMNYTGFVFEKGGRLYVPVVLIPLLYVKEYGVDFSQFIFERLKYIDASKER